MFIPPSVTHFAGAALLLLVATAVCTGAASVRDFGARGDGATDDTNAFRAAIEHAGARNEPLLIPAGRYVIVEDIPIDRSIRFIGEAHEESVITSHGRPARFRVKASGTVFENLGFERMIDPIALVSRSSYLLENLRFERCRFQAMAAGDRNRGVIGLSSGTSSQRAYPIRALVIEDCIFEDIDAFAINLRANISDATVRNNQFLSIVNDRKEGASILGGYAIRLGESSDDAGMLEEFSAQGRHLIEGNVIRRMRKRTRQGNLIGMLLYGNYMTIRSNVIEDIDGTVEGRDTNAMYIRGAFNEVLANTIRNIRGSDDDGALSFKGGLDIGSRHNIAAHNRIENIDGLSAVEASTDGLRFLNNEIVNARPRGFQQRAGEGLEMKNNSFHHADTNIRTQSGRVVISGNHYLHSRISLSQRRAHPSDREGVFIEGNTFRFTEESLPLVRLANNVEERVVSITNNRFERLGGGTAEGNLVDLAANGDLHEVQIVGNEIWQKEPAGTLTFEVDSSKEQIGRNPVSVR